MIKKVPDVFHRGDLLRIPLSISAPHLDTVLPRHVQPPATMDSHNGWHSLLNSVVFKDIYLSKWQNLENLPCIFMQTYLRIFTLIVVLTFMRTLEWWPAARLFRISWHRPAGDSAISRGRGPWSFDPGLIERSLCMVGSLRGCFDHIPHISSSGWAPTDRIDENSRSQPHLKVRDTMINSKFPDRRNRTAIQSPWSLETTIHKNG